MKLLSLSITLAILFMGCSTKEYQLFQADYNSSSISHSQDISISYESRILPDDILSIDIYNMNQKSNILRDSTLLSSTNSESKNRYIVAPDGTIYLPLLQEVKVQGLTIKEMNRQLTNRYKKYLKQPYVKVTIKNHKVFVLGEVVKQGIVPIEGNSISVIEAISKSGGLTDHALQDRIRVITKENGKHRLKTLDLSKLSTLNIDNLMLKHNSILYIEPKSSKALKVGVQDYLPLIQAISSIASTFLSIDYISSK
ncbi:Polysaccharide export lipoprotein Wza [hydrothermal vent metagenome]|uniref:Polysaccharide export lipoprotein Wza n=1 Tax=hydrothermal vent metagenome TaxID=652676 RepID=A0A1W1CCZ4_9ZZZZ